MASLIDFSFRDLRDKFLADLSKAECEVREHLVNASAVIQVRAAVPVSASVVQGSTNAIVVSASTTDEIAALEKKLQDQENAHTATVMTLEKDMKKLRKENVELQGKLADTGAVDKLEADLEAAHRQIRTLTQENIVLRNSQVLNDKYADQDKKLYAELEAKYKALEEKYAKLEISYSEKQKEVAPTPAPSKVEEPKKEVKKVENPQHQPEPEEEEVEEEAEEEAEEEGEEPVEFEYKGKTYYLSSDNDVYQMENDEFVQVGTWNGKKILFQ